MRRLARTTVPSAIDSLEPFVLGGVLGSAEVHVAEAVVRLACETDPTVALGAALAVRAAQAGHVGFRPDEIRDVVVPEASDLLDNRTAASGDLSKPEDLSNPEDLLNDVSSLPWPDPLSWIEALSKSPAVRTVGPSEPEGDSGPLRPLVLDAGRLYLERHWRDELAVAADLLERARPPSRTVDDADRNRYDAGRKPDHADRKLDDAGADPRHREILDLLFPPDPGSSGPAGRGSAGQRAAAAAALGGRLVVIAGGPGTGKTYTVARLLAAAHATAGPSCLRAALTAPTGKAAARLGEAVAAALAQIGSALPPETADALANTETATLHRLLGAVPEPPFFRRDARDPLPHDLVVVDETSMVSLPLMARLLDAVRPDATLVLVGDPAQLASIEAGSVLGDLVLAASGPDSPLAGCVHHLDEGFRFGGGSPVAELADAVRSGAADDVVAVLDRPDGAVRGLPRDQLGMATAAEPVLDAAFAVVEAARQGDAHRALAEAQRVKVLAATRAGPGGTRAWTRLVESAIATRSTRPDRSGRPGRSGWPDRSGWYVGRPVMVTRNDPMTGLFNGDTGVAVAGATGVEVVFPGDRRDPDSLRRFRTSQLDDVETWWAMTVHKSQGSELDHVVVSLPDARSRTLSRELLYTAVTRARAEVTVVADPEAVRAALLRPVARASALADRLR